MFGCRIRRLKRLRRGSEPQQSSDAGGDEGASAQARGEPEGVRHKPRQMG